MNPFKYIVKWSVLSVLMLFSLPSCASTSHTKASASSNQNLEQMVGGVCKRADTGVLAESLSSGKVLYTYKADATFAPASNMKLITAYAALKFLGPDFQYHTQLLSDASPTPEGVLASNLYVKFDGDPGLQLQDLEAMVKQLHAAGVRTVQGSLVIDGTRYDNDGVSPGTVATDRRYCYGAPVEATIVNHNCLSFRLLPGAQVGAPALMDMPYGMKLPSMSTVSTSAGTHCHLSLLADANGDYHLSGCVSLHARPASFTLPTPEGSKVGEAAMVALLNRYQITVLGDARFAIRGAHPHLQVLVDMPSKPLIELLQPMMRNSDNLFANTLFKTLGARYNKQSGTWQNSAAAVKAILQANGIETSSMVIIDGSGLSRNNLVSARQLVDVLRAAYRDPAISHAYFDALPVGGMNGTLKHRLGFRETIGKVHAKSGSMHDMSALSGYIASKGDDMVVFSILVNNFSGSRFTYRSFEDQACRYLSGQLG